MECHCACEVVVGVLLVWELRLGGVFELWVEGWWRVWHEYLSALLFTLGYYFIACFGPDPFPCWCRTGYHAVGILPVLVGFWRGWSTAVALVLFVLFACVVDVAFHDIDGRILRLQCIHDLGGGVSSFCHLFQIAHLLFGHFAQGRVSGEILGRFVIVLLFLGFHLPNIVFQDSNDHEGASHEAAVSSLAFPLLISDVASVLVLTTPVAFEPQTIGTRA